jgi:hypothetical protein
MGNNHLKHFRKSLLLLGGLFLLYPGPLLAKIETNLSKALKSGDKTIEFSGKEKESVKIPKGVRVVGSSPDKAIISNDIVMANGSSLENITVDGKIISITVEKGANVTLSNVTVSGGSDTGIFAPKGGATLTIHNSRIRQNRKGIFLLEGNKVFLSGTTITNNREEGLDMHSGTQGSITGSTFSGNAEGGVEVIINGSGLSMTNNIFSGNQASGLALQSYGGGGGGGETGTFTLSGNSFVNNGNFGVDCKNPQGTGGAFFGASVNASGNTLSGNKKGAINPECGIANRTEMRDDETSEVGTDETGSTDIDEEEGQEAVTTTTLSQEIADQIQKENDRYTEKLLQDSRVLKEESSHYQERIRKRAWFYPKTETTKMNLIQELDKLKKETNDCSVVASKDVSIPLDKTIMLCTKAEQESILNNLANAEEHLEYSFFTQSKKKFFLWKNQVEDFFLREEWKFR